MEWQDKGCLITDDRARIDFDAVIQFLTEESYWAQDLTPQQIRRSIQNSLCFSVWEGRNQIGFARVLTDYAVFGYIGDVFIIASHRGKGLGKWLMQCVMSHPKVKALKKIMLATTDAHGLYTQYGFTQLGHPEWMMERYNRNGFDNFSVA